MGTPVLRSIFLLLTAVMLSTVPARPESRTQDPAPYQSFSNQKYSIEIDVDYQAQTYSGRETVTFTNSTKRDIDQVSFHLYPNIGLNGDEFPWLTVQGVKLVLNTFAKYSQTRFVLREGNSVLQVKLPFKLEPGRSVSLLVEFAAQVPRIQREETTLLAHFLEEASDAVSTEKPSRDSRDIFFACDQTLLLGYFHPVLAAPEIKSPNPAQAVGIGGLVNNEIADYDLKVTLQPGIALVSSLPPAEATPATADNVHYFHGTNVRGIAIALSDNLKKTENTVGGIRLTTFAVPGDERVGQRISDIAANALKSYSEAFGAYPFPNLTVVELPLPAGFGGIEFPGLVAIAQAYCIDFQSAQAARLPSMVREQADVITSALEVTLGQSIAFQWWGSAVGTDSQKFPYLDEALAHFSATYAFEKAYGPEAGAKAIEQHIRAPYQVYRSLGGVDVEVGKPAKEYRSALQFSAIVQAKGGMLFHQLRKELGDEQFFTALRTYYSSRKFKLAGPAQLRESFILASSNPNTVRSLFQRYLKEKHGDEDLGKPETALLSSPDKPKGNRLGRLFVKIGRVAATPF